MQISRCCIFSHPFDLNLWEAWVQASPQVSLLVWKEFYKNFWGIRESCSYLSKTIDSYFKFFLAQNRGAVQLCSRWAITTQPKWNFDACWAACANHTHFSTKCAFCSLPGRSFLSAIKFLSFCLFFSLFLFLSLFNKQSM